MANTPLSMPSGAARGNRTPALIPASDANCEPFGIRSGVQSLDLFDQGRRANEPKITVAYIDKLQRENADDLAFYPLTSLAKALENRHILSCEENGEPAGYLWFGALNQGDDVIIYQACIDYQARRRHLGYSLVGQLLDLARAGGCRGIRLKCASSAESNEFWQAIGFYCTRVSTGGIRRGRQRNHYRMDIQSPLLVAPSVLPSNAPISPREYHRLRAAGVVMPSPWDQPGGAL